MTKALAALVALAFAIALLAAATMAQAFLWYCFDDRLADILGQPEIGSVPFTVAWPATIFLTSVFSGAGATVSNKEKRK